MAKKIIVGVFIVALIIITIYVFFIKSNNSQFSSSKTTEIATEELLKTNALVFTDVEFPYTEANNGDNLNIICYYQNNTGSELEAKAEISLLSTSNNKFRIFQQNIGVIVRGGGRISLSFPLTNVAAGNYKAVLDVFGLKDNISRGGCGTPDFVVL